MAVKSADAWQTHWRDATSCSGNCPLSEGSPLTFPHLWRPNMNLFKQANMYLCGVLYSYDFKSHDQYHNGRILNCYGERRDLSCELPHFYANVDFGSPPLAREPWRKKKKAKNKTVLPRIHLLESPERLLWQRSKLSPSLFFSRETVTWNNRKSIVEGQILVVGMK